MTLGNKIAELRKDKGMTQEVLANITCDNIGGNAVAGGNITCDEISGNVSMGSLFRVTK